MTASSDGHGTRLCAGRVVIVTGAGRGLGRAHALAFAAEGAKVVVNDLGVGLDGAGGSSPGPARQVVDEIEAAGGEAVAHDGDIATGAGAASLIGIALDTFGRLDTLVNNAGFLRDRMLVNLDEDDWDAVLRVHLKGHFLTLKHAAAHWRAETKAGRTTVARVINTSSGAGLLGSVGQGNYSAAKAGIVGLTLVAAAELGRYGVQANAIAPAARTRMTEQTFAETMAAPGEGAGAFDAMAPENVSPLVVWLGSAASDGVTGRVFEAEAGRITVMEGWHPGPSVDRGARWTPAEAGRPHGNSWRRRGRGGRCTGRGDGRKVPATVWKPASPAMDERVTGQRAPASGRGRQGPPPTAGAPTPPPTLRCRSPAPCGRARTAPAPAPAPQPGSAEGTSGTRTRPAARPDRPRRRTEHRSRAPRRCPDGPGRTGGPSRSAAGRPPRRHERWLPGVLLRPRPPRRERLVGLRAGEPR